MWSPEERRLRALATNHGFTISVFAAVAITAIFACLCRASQEFAAVQLTLGILTAMAENVLHPTSGALAATAITPIHTRIGNESNCANERESFR
jgi:CBS-domain-containing membrane protein